MKGFESRSITAVILWLSPLLSVGCVYDPALIPLAPGQAPTAPDTVSVSIQNYVPQPGKIFKDLFVSNFSVKASKATLTYSAARDGQPDDFKKARGNDYGLVVGGGPYSANPGFSDFMLYLMGIDVTQQPLLNCADNLKLSSSNDAFIYVDKSEAGSPQALLGLRDCEKLYAGLNPALFDNSGTGIPDYLKLRCGMNPKNAHDSHLSLAGDAVSNYDKCKEHIPLDESSDSVANRLFAYKYKFEELAAPAPSGSKNLSVSNIPILNGGKDNFLAFYLLESDIHLKTVSLYTAYVVLKAGSAGLNLKVTYWATDPTKFTNQEVILP